ncbi:probable calcium-transporting ATPase 11, plasma membrane-t [Coccomyxa sp. Obi]|nr:probable calcium-transporting ATPase 11, plasma membrane-t [Coccomyxa sp. Obi]
MGKATKGGEAEAADFPSSVYGIFPKALSELSEHKDTEALEKLGGYEGLAKALNTSLDDGVNPDAVDDTSVQRRAELFGANKFPQVPLKSFFALLWGNLSDKILILLMVAATISTVLGAALPEERANSGWTEGVAIWVAVIVVSFVATGNDYQKDLQFRKINSQKNSIEVAVVRGGKQAMVKNTDIVVGDIMLLNTGDKIVADGIVTDSHGLVIDEASLTGESDPMHKGDKDCWVRSGTQVTEGSGKMLVVAVGTDSEWGRTMALVATEASPTPLQDSLGVLATAIGKIGLTVGIVCFVVLFVRWLIQNRGFPVDQISEGPLAFFIFGVTIVVVAVPEGLPLAVTISLAYSMKKMMKDNNFVRVLAACETMGGATAICSDKTGTLTENRMTVVAGWFAGKIWPSPPPLNELPESLQTDIKLNSALNSKAFLIEHDENAVEFAGNRTECALLMLLRGWGIKYDAIRAEHKHDMFRVYNFSSERKMASVILRTPTGLRLFNKGAAEIVLRRCVNVMDPNGVAVPLIDEMRAMLEETVTTMASSGLRTLCLTTRDLDESAADGNSEYWDNPPDDHLTLCCIVGIKDPVRKEVPGAVATCQRAGITVRMVTGDNIHTAKHIARECGILTDGGTAMEGPVFRSMPEEDLIPVLPKLQVLARSSPQDKYVLVKLLKKLGEIVAVTGDGTNDAPALKESDVGLAMGIAGTEVAKEAADIVILDDNFSSIVKSVLWGRSVFGNIRKFLQFQLTVNFVALVVAFIAAITTGETPLNVLQLLWVNLIMDALGALALATEPPTPELLLEEPHGRDEQLISAKMWKHILTQGCYQLFWLFLIFYGAPKTLPAFYLSSECVTYANLEASGLSLSAINPNLAAPWSTPPGPKPTANYPDNARCAYGPCLNACCTTDAATGFCVDNLVSQGGLYYPYEQPLCGLSAVDPGVQPKCTRTRAKNIKSNFCQNQTDTSNCERTQQFQALDNKADNQYKAHHDYDLRKTNSIVFNSFIFMQLFNQINARKINDELNVFDGIFRAPMFLYIWFIEAILQVIIMVTPINTFFRVSTQNWQEWLFAIALGAGSIPVAIIIKLLSRLFAPVGTWVMQRPTAVAAKDHISRSRTHLQGARCREGAVLPRVTFRRSARKRRGSGGALDPTYSLERSRVMKGAASKKGEGSASKRVSSGPSGMYTEHIYWARTLSKQPSKAPRASRDAKQPASPATDTYPILTWTA